MAGSGGSVRRRPVGGWVEENMRNWIIQRGMMGEVGCKKKFEVEDSKGKTKIVVEVNYFSEKLLLQKHMNLKWA